MATNFPTSLDSLTNPAGTDLVTSPDHAAQHANANDAIEALQSRIGIKGSVAARVTTVTSSATPTLNTDSSDSLTITALAANITSMTTNLTGTPDNFQRLIVRIKDNGTPRTIAWGAKFSPMGVALPTTTTTSKVLTVGFIYDTVTAAWGCVASATEA